MDPRETKAQLRSAIKDRLSHLSARDRAAESRSICRRILEELGDASQTICAYFPLNDEADLRPLFTELLKRGDRVFLPKVEAGKMNFRQMKTVEELKTGTFGIPEPSDDAPLLEPSDVTVVLVPGRAFDRSGSRLGRGNGGYDIWIRKQREENPKMQFWGVALECQLTQEIPTEAHDEKMDAIVTARGVVKRS